MIAPTDVSDETGSVASHDGGRPTVMVEQGSPSPGHGVPVNSVYGYTSKSGSWGGSCPSLCGRLPGRLLAPDRAGAQEVVHHAGHHEADEERHVAQRRDGAGEG